MAVVHYKARVDAEGNLVIPDIKLPTGMEVDVAIELQDEGNELTLTLEDDSVFWALARPAFEFWDNPIDNEVWG